MIIIGVILGIIGTLFDEINDSIVKNKAQKCDILTLGVITIFFSFIIFLFSGIYKYFSTDLVLYFNPASIYFLLIRVFFEILQAYFTIKAIKYADRSTFSIIRILTIPLLVIVDIVLGYNFTIYSFIGIGIIIFSFLLFNIKIKAINFKGVYYVLFTLVNAVITLSLFKYSISHYGNSIEIDQFVCTFSIFIFFLIYNYKNNKSCALKLIFKDKQFLIQGIIIALSSIIISYSYLYLNASEATAIKRAGDMVWSIFFGFIFFKEKNLIKKLFFAFFIIIGMIIMVL